MTISLCTNTVSEKVTQLVIWKPLNFTASSMSTRKHFLLNTLLTKSLDDVRYFENMVKEI